MVSLLVCENVSKNFGGLKAVNQVDLKVEQDELIGIIGPNGSGKTTLFNLITGFLRPSSGNIEYEGRDINKLPPHVIASRGLIRTFQKINVFGELSVLDNVLIGKHLHIESGFLRSLLQSRKKHLDEKLASDEVLRILESMGLSGWQNQKAKSLPLGLQRALGIAVGISANPKLLLLDEPTSGMTTEETKHLIEVIRKVHQSGITILIVEHDMNFVMQLSQRIIVLKYGIVVAEGKPEEIQSDPKVIEVYLGKGYKHVVKTA